MTERVENARQARESTVGFKGYPFARGFAPASPVLFRERLEELVKGYRGLTGRDGFRLPRFGGRGLFRLGTFNARARVKHTLFFLLFFWRRKRKRGIARIMLGQCLSIR